MIFVSSYRSCCALKTKLCSILQRTQPCLLLQLRVRNYSQNHPVEYAADIITSMPHTNVVAVVGAGISTPSGIPDFRSKGSGLYDNLEEYNLKNATDIFDLYFFRKNPSPFFRLAKYLYPGNYQPNYVHYFLKVLSDKKKLLRIYTQNIDGLEYLAGIPDTEIVAAHGSFNSATCMKCRESYDGELIKSDVMSDIIPICRNDWCNGVVKPDIVFFGENLPEQFFQWESDLKNSHLLIVLGTSLEVFPVAGVVYGAPTKLPRVLFNREVVAPFNGGWETRKTDAAYEGDVVEGIRELTDRLQWISDVDKYISG